MNIIKEEAECDNINDDEDNSPKLKETLQSESFMKFTK